MLKIFMLAYSNIRRSRSGSMSLVVMFVISALLFNIGLLVLLKFGNFFGSMIDELYTSDQYYLIPSQLYSKSVESVLKTSDNIIDISEETSKLSTGTIINKDNKKKCNILFNNSKSNRTLSKWKFVGEKNDNQENAVYIPYSLKIDFNLNLNDELKIVLEGKEFNLKISGFAEDMYFSSLVDVLGLYLPPKTYEYIDKELGENNSAKLIFTKLKNQNMDIVTKIQELTKEDSITFNKNVFTSEIGFIKMLRTITVTIVAIIMIVFSVIITFVCLIIVRFRIINTIEEDIQKIGSLKAVGFSNINIILSNILQFLTIAIFGCIIGISISYTVVPVISDIFASQSGFKWVQGFDIITFLIVLTGILSIVILTSFLTSFRIRKLTPVTALKGGFVNHNFKKNYFEFEKTSGSIVFILALKNIFSNIKQSITVFIILLCISFAGAYSMVLYYNTTFDTSTFAEVPGYEISNALISLNPNLDNTKFINEISKEKEVAKVQFLDITNAMIDNCNGFVNIMDDYSKKNTNTIYEGRYPKHNNEISVAGYLAGMINKKVGDSVDINFNGVKKSFLITGLTQGSVYGGMDVFITTEAATNLDKNFKQQSLYIYLNKGEDASKFVSKVEMNYKDQFMKIFDKDKELEEGMSKYAEILSKVGMFIMIFTIIIVVLFLYFIINSLIIKRKKELGIQKAMGFTNIQLMNQISLGLMPQIVFGVVLGCILGIMQTNNLMALSQSAAKIMKANYIIPSMWIFVLGGFIVLTSYLTAMAITFKIREISVNSLINE